MRGFTEGIVGVAVIGVFAAIGAIAYIKEGLFGVLASIALMAIGAAIVAVIDD